MAFKTFNAYLESKINWKMLIKKQSCQKKSTFKISKTIIVHFLRICHMKMNDKGYNIYSDCVF